MEPRRYRAGESIEDFCRVCKTDRMHTVVAADGDGRPIRVDCGYCHSEHNYRGGARIDVGDGASRVGADLRVPPSPGYGEARQSAKRAGGGPERTPGSAPTDAVRATAGRP